MKKKEKKWKKSEKKNRKKREKKGKNNLYTWDNAEVSNIREKPLFNFSVISNNDCRSLGGLTHISLGFCINYAVICTDFFILRLFTNIIEYGGGGGTE